MTDDTTAQAHRELAEKWLDALGDVDTFAPLCHPEAQVWHSVDDVWMTVDQAIADVHKGGGLPPRSEESYRLTEDGFLVQFTLTVADITMHNTILVRMREGLAYRIEEYVGLEQDVRGILMDKLGIPH